MAENNLKVTYEAVLDIVTYDRKVTPVIKIAQGDTCTRFIHAKILKNEVDFMLSSSAYTITANYKRPDGETKICDVTVQADGTLTVELPSWVSEVAGEGKCDISLSYTDDEGAHKLTTPDISIKISQACAPNGATGDN